MEHYVGTAQKAKSRRCATRWPTARSRGRTCSSSTTSPTPAVHRDGSRVRARPKRQQRPNGDAPVTPDQRPRTGVRRRVPRRVDLGRRPLDFVEDMVERVAGVMAKSDQQTHTEDDIRRCSGSTTASAARPRDRTPNRRARSRPRWNGGVSSNRPATGGNSLTTKQVNGSAQQVRTNPLVSPLTIARPSTLSR